MSEIMQARTVMAKKLNVMVRKIEGVSSFILTGNDEYTPNEIFFVVAASDNSQRSKVLADLDFLIRQFLRPFDIQKNESDGRTLVNYLFDNGLKAQVNICTENNLPPFTWWVPYLDKNGAAMGFYPASGRKISDPTTDKPQPENNPTDDSDNAPAEVQPEAPVPVTVPESALPTPAPAQSFLEPKSESQSDRELWNYFYSRVNVAKHAIAGGSVIYACETIGEIRTFLIRLICETNGITEDYLHSIDLLPESQRSELLKTYPAKPENGPMISAIAAEHSIFEKLMKNTSR